MPEQNSGGYIRIGAYFLLFLGCFLGIYVPLSWWVTSKTTFYEAAWVADLYMYVILAIGLAIMLTSFAVLFRGASSRKARFKLVYTALILVFLSASYPVIRYSLWKADIKRCTAGFIAYADKNWIPLAGNQPISVVARDAYEGRISKDISITFHGPADLHGSSIELHASRIDSQHLGMTSIWDNLAMKISVPSVTVKSKMEALSLLRKLSIRDSRLVYKGLSKPFRWSEEKQYSFFSPLAKGIYYIGQEEDSTEVLLLLPENTVIDISK